MLQIARRDFLYTTGIQQENNSAMHYPRHEICSATQERFLIYKSQLAYSEQSICNQEQSIASKQCWKRRPKKKQK